MLRMGQAFEELVAAPVDKLDGHAVSRRPVCPLLHMLIPALLR
jgi:hypothetical protein